VTNRGVWAVDGHVVMEDISALKLVSMGLLQTSGYVTKQMHAEVKIDVNKFLSAFSIKTKDGLLHPPSWIPCEDENDSVDILPNPPSSSSTSTMDAFNMSDYSKCRQAEAIRWVDLREKRASIIPRLQPVTAEEYQELRVAILSVSGPVQRTVGKGSGEYSVSPFVDVH
jgi:hypothetical protein